MPKIVQNSHGYVSPTIYRKLYTNIFIGIFIMCFVFFVSGVIFDEKAVIILSACIFVLGILCYIYMLPIFSKYYITERKVVLKVGNIYTKDVPLEHSKTRIVKLDSKDGTNVLVSQDYYIIIANHDVNIDEVLHYTEKELLKVLKTKDVIAIPESATKALYNRYK